MVQTVLLVLGIVLLGHGMCFPQETLPQSSHRVPVLAELFTSEGCSSCPPADHLLEVLDSQPIPGVEVVVLSEHVDYWNHDGWTDPYSSPEFSERQKIYASRFKLDDVYTPQLVVDGWRQVSGNNTKAVEAALQEAQTQAKMELYITQLAYEQGRLRARIEATPLTQPNVHTLDVYLVVALNHAESRVTRGENANHHLTHTAVVRKIKHVGKLRTDKPFSQDVELKIDSKIEPNNLRLVAFLKDEDSQRVFGAIVKQIR